MPEHIGHLSLTLVLSRNVAHQKQVSHRTKIETAAGGFDNKDNSEHTLLRFTVDKVCG